MNSSELALYLEAGFIDFNIETDERFLPKILTNNQQEQVKVLENLLFELEHCDEFFFSVAFVTNSGIACLIDTLKDFGFAIPKFYGTASTAQIAAVSQSGIEDYYF